MTETTASSRQTAKRRGFNLIEAAIVLGVVGLVIGGIWVAAAAVSDHFKVSRTVGGLIKTCDNAARVFSRKMAPQVDAVLDIKDAAISAGVPPSDWIQGALIVPPVGSSLWVYQIGASNSASHLQDQLGMVQYHLNDLPNKYCRQIMPVMARNPTIFSTIYVGTGVGSGHSWDTITKRVPPYTNPMDWCGTGDATTGNNKIAFVCGY